LASNRGRGVGNVVIAASHVSLGQRQWSLELSFHICN